MNRITQVIAIHQWMKINTGQFWKKTVLTIDNYPKNRFLINLFKANCLLALKCLSKSPDLNTSLRLMLRDAVNLISSIRKAEQAET